jgi:hypothetical protein
MLARHPVAGDAAEKEQSTKWGSFWDSAVNVLRILRRLIGALNLTISSLEIFLMNQSCYFDDMTALSGRQPLENIRATLLELKHLKYKLDNVQENLLFLQSQVSAILLMTKISEKWELIACRWEPR